MEINFMARKTLILQTMFVAFLITSTFAFALSAPVGVPSRAPINSSWFSPQIFLYVSGFAAGFYKNRESFFFSVYKVTEFGNGELMVPFWLANRNHPLFMNGTMEFDQTGNLVLKDHGKNLVWESNTSWKGVVGMELRETGNLVLYDGGNRTIWQSFSSPGDILVPGQRLELGQSLITSIASDNFTEGDFRLSVEPDRVLLGFVGSSLSYGKWCFGHSDVIGFVSMQTKSLTCHRKDGSEIISIDFKEESSILHLTAEGNLDVSTPDFKSSSLASSFIEQDNLLPPCGMPGSCGEYGVCTGGGDCACISNFSSPIDSNNLKQGCKLNQAVNCSGNSELVRVPGLFPTPRYITGYMQEEDCRSLCLRNCSCMGVVYSQQGCLQMPKIFTMVQNGYYSDYYNVTVLLKMSLDLDKVPNATYNNGAKRGTSILRETRSATTVYILVGIISGAVVIMGLAIWKFYDAMTFLKPSERRKCSGKKPSLPDNLPVHFEYEELSKMTNEFQNKIAQGGFSTVFEGTLENGTRVAVKRLESAKQGLKQFDTEVKTICNIHHRNLVKLEGYGIGEHDYYLVYEFVHNLSLDNWLFTDNHQQTLCWKTRCQIAIDVARGLDYLHTGCKNQVLHLDIKPQNILLDANFEAKICDFGLARLLDRSDDVEQNFVNTIMRGTPGYMAPEWLHSRVTDKADVYSFGVVLLELVSGRKAVPLPSSFASCHGGAAAKTLRIKDLEKSESLLNNVDPRLVSMHDFDVGEANDMVAIGLCCVKEDQHCRPSVGVVLKMLEEAFANK